MAGASSSSGLGAAGWIPINKNFSLIGVKMSTASSSWSSSSSSSNVSLKLFIDTKSQRVVFAEADKTAVDFLIHILSLPMGAVIMFLTTDQMVGSLGNLYHSFENLSETYIQSIKNKEKLLKPKNPPLLPRSSSPLLTLPPTRDSRVYFRCKTSKHAFVADHPSADCPTCGSSMNIMVEYVASPVVVGDVGVGFVKGGAMYMVMDDLMVKPISTFTLLSMLDSKGLSSKDLEEKVVHIGMKEALHLLKTSLVSKTVLTTVFLKRTETVMNEQHCCKRQKL